jgi:hypothetical protein
VGKSDSLHPDLDGRGGGYGKFQGKTVAEIRELFAKCETDPSMRSVSVVLRVAREQLDARGGLGYYPVYAGCAVAALILSFLLKPILPTTMAAELPKFQVGIGVVSVALIVGVVITGRDRRAGLAQEQAIRIATRETLEKIVKQEAFVRKPLDFTQDLTLKKVLEECKDSPAAVLFEV